MNECEGVNCSEVLSKLILLKAASNINNNINKEMLQSGKKKKEKSVKSHRTSFALC